MERKLYLISNYTSEKIQLNDDNTCSVNGVNISIEDTINKFKKRVYQYGLLRAQILIGICNPNLEKGKGGYTYEWGNRLDQIIDYCI